jgi:dTDP-glucose pyrophosphorylase
MRKSLNALADSRISMRVALIMAGGRSERMRASSGPQHKALVRILGLSMLERNLCKLLSFGFREIVVAINAQESELERYVADRGMALAAARGARLQCLKEDVPLGTIGIARELKGWSEAVLVVNVDNLTALDLRLLVDRHLESGAALTIATHVEPFQIPFGEVRLNGDFITDYLEKPVRRIRVSSGTYVLAPKACELINAVPPTSVPQLFEALIRQGEPVMAFEHTAAWIDVNDAAAAARAEQLIRDHLCEFEYWDQTPDRELATLLLCGPSRIFVEQRADTASRYRGLWDIPAAQIKAEDGSPLQALARRIHQQGWRCSDLEPLTSFDDLDYSTGKLLRHHVFSARAEGSFSALTPGAKQRWMALEESNSSPALSPALTRALASMRSAS